MFLDAVRVGRKRRIEALVDRTLGSNIGDLTTNDGLAAIFDGTTSQGVINCGTKSTTTFGYAGKTYTAAKIFSRVVVYGANNGGFAPLANPSVTLALYGKNGSAPASSTDGALVASWTFTDGTDGAAQTINASSNKASFLHWWVRVDIGSSGNIALAEVVMYEVI